MPNKSAISFHDIKSPLSVQFELTGACNHKCIHCYNYWRDPGESVGTILKVDLENVMAKLAASETQLIVFTGGEPLLVPDLLFSGIDLAQKYGIQCGLNTNLSLLTQDMAVELKRRGMGVLTSFPTHDPKTFDEIVGREGAYQRVYKGIKTAQRNGIPVFANMVVMQQNFGHVIDTALFLRNEGIYEFSATRVHPTQSSRNYDELKLSKEQMMSILDDLIELRDAWDMKVDSLSCYSRCMIGDLKKYGSLMLERHCTAGKVEAAIGPDGSMRACAHSDEVYGNVIKEDIPEVWERMKEWRDGSLIPEVCEPCKCVAVCGGGCRADAKYTQGSKDKVDPYVVLGAFEGEFPPLAELPKIDPDAIMVVNPNLRFREEEIGTFLVCGSTRKLVTHDTADLLRSMREAPFVLSEIIERHKLDNGFAMEFFASLTKDRVIGESDKCSHARCDPNARLEM